MAPAAPPPRLPVLLRPGMPFPPIERALSSPDGLLAVGGDLSLERLREAYRHGIFPWFLPGEPLLWWSPDPRMVLPTQAFSPSHSLRKTLRRIEGCPSVEIRVDTAFDQVLRACAGPRGPGRATTWITPEMRQAYLAWHRAGDVHSVETWIDGELMGGLYGVSLGRMFFGESMFARTTDASKIALAYLVRFLRAQGVALIDCQQQTSHLASMGAGPIARADFSRMLAATSLPGIEWYPGRLDADGYLYPLDLPPRPSCPPCPRPETNGMP